MAAVLGVAGLAALGVSSSPATPVAHAAAATRFVSGWIPYWEMDDNDGVYGVKAAPSLFADVSVFDFDVTGATTVNLQGGELVYARAVTAARAAGLTTFGTLVDHMGKGGMASVLADPAARAAHVQAIVDLAVARSLDGIDVDYENFAFTDGTSTWPTTQPLWVAFINELGTAMHARGKLLAVSVPAIWDGGRRGYTVYDWAGIIDSVDRMRIMTYDWSSSQAGPNAPMSWVNSVIAYAKATIPGSLRKLQLGVPTYGYSFARIASGTCPRNASLSKLPVQTESALDLAASKGATPVRDAVSGEMTFSYDTTYQGTLDVAPSPPGYTPPADVSGVVDEADPTGLRVAMRVIATGQVVSCVVRRTVFYPDAKAVVDRANAALAGGFSGIAIWALGYESPDVWAALAGVQAPTPATWLGTGTLGSLDAAKVVPDGVEVRGWAFDPEVGVPVNVQVSVDGGPWGDPVLARERRDDVAQAFDGVAADHGFAAVVPLTTQSGSTVCVRAIGWGDDAEPVDVGCVAAIDPAAVAPVAPTEADPAAADTVAEPTTSAPSTGSTSTSSTVSAP